ncbi:DNA-binding transcriptional regulator, LysR family [Arachidicoccus rhizosphaerae]|uniref:DNA-binding transcriptional regulator, LysR family n=1 Tax=Arachidicoccus rhizosphaerae TaxID=551991 RepID=A0A1H4C7S9_9BACT|nr:LysR substrate-binding domain-containing protein [Arachidicoccus rhizosphaerae]SEA56399.1 DNA-binding transcriptional regulator, LysR family [Arachidicoccus rhizosphaerae]
MDVDTSVLRNFLQVAETLHFTRSSEQMHIAQPALSRQIRQLEDKLGVSLFERNKRNVELTAAGRYFKKECELILKQFDYVALQANSLFKGKSGVIRIGYTHSAMHDFLPDLIRHINQIFPDIKIVLLEFNNSRQYIALKNREIDIGFATNPDIDSSFKSKLLLRSNFALVTPLDFPLDKNKPFDLYKLKDQEFILPPMEEGEMYVSTLTSIFVQAGFMPKVVHETPFASTAIRLVEKGFGLTVEPLSSLTGYKGVKYLELKDIAQKVENVMLWLPNTETAFPGIIQQILDYKYK